MNYMKTRLFYGLLFFFLISFPTDADARQATGVDPDEKAKATQAYIQAITDFENEDYEQALELLTAAHVVLAEEPGVNFALADLYLATGDLTNAAYYGKTAVDLDPENKWYHLKLAEIYRKAGRNEATTEAYKNALTYFPNDVEILFQLAQSYVNFGKLLEANHIYDDILDLRGSNFDVHLRKFRNFNALNMRDEALNELQQMRKIDPGNLSTLRSISQYYFELGEPEMALEVLLEAKERNARDPQTLLMLAEIYVQQSDWEQLGNIFVSMLEDPLIYPSQKLELVRYMYQQHQSEPENRELSLQVDEVLIAFSENEPEYGPAQLLAAEFFLQQNDFETALEKLELVNRLIPNQPDAWRQRMQVLFTLERYEEVIELSDEADSKASDDAFVQFFAGAAYMLQDQPNEAKKWLENASLSPANRNFRSVINGTLGDVYQDLDEWEDAKSAYEMALRLDPNNHNAMNNYAYFMTVRGERLDYAKELAEKAISFEPENSAYLDTVGWIYYKLENYEQALEYITRSVETGDASAEVFEHLGDVYYALDQPEDAIEWWNKALENDSDREYLNNRIESARP